MEVSRRSFLVGGATLAAAACSNTSPRAAATRFTAPSGQPSPLNAMRWSMPDEATPHKRTWMCWPSDHQIWGSTIADVQETIAVIASVVSSFEPVTMLARPDEISRLRRRLGTEVELIEAPVDDLWARDTLPVFLTANSPTDSEPTALSRFRFNGWGDKQRHKGDTQLGAAVADILEIPILDPGITGEGGGVVTDGSGTAMAAKSSWINDNRNPGWSQQDVTSVLLELLGANQMIWVDGLKGEDITDGHIDSLARFVGDTTIIRDVTSYVEPGEVWYDLSVAVASQLTTATNYAGRPFDSVVMRQPQNPRGQSNTFLATYVNYYVCNGAVIAPEFGDRQADKIAADQLQQLYPNREVVQINIDPVADGGGGIHCATQNQPV